MVHASPLKTRKPRRTRRSVEEERKREKKRRTALFALEIRKKCARRNVYFKSWEVAEQ